MGTGSTNAPWHFEDEKGKLVGMDIAMAHILAKGLFDDPDAFEFVQQDPAARIPNINTSSNIESHGFYFICGVLSKQTPNHK